MKEIIISEKKIGNSNPVFLIGEAGVNHNGKLSIAKKLIDKASEANVDAIKFQTFITDKLVLKKAPKANYQKRTKNDDENFYEMVKKYEFSKDQFRILRNYCTEKGLIFLSTPFDELSVKWLEDLDVPIFKVGSGDLNNFPLLKLICSKNKPIFLSTGMSTLEEVKESVNFIKSNGVNEIVIFQCTSDYPTPYEDVNLNVISTYKKTFPNELIGFSDHSKGIVASIGAVVKGAKVIEKHFTLNKDMEGPDHKASLDPDELSMWVSSIRTIEKALGTYEKNPSLSEFEIARIARKSIVTSKDIKKGDLLSLENITVKRPGIGIPPTKFDLILGKKINKDLPKDSIINWEDIE
ncbi:MAG: N-acetylneuraminate synthase [Promethearchaeota archaeon]|jgi:N-acetylneuraminate synthase